jgi:hypothetical protein
LGAAERRGHGGIYIQAIQAGGAPSPANERPAPASPPQLVLEIPIYLYYTKSCNIYTSGIADAPTKSHSPSGIFASYPLATRNFSPLIPQNSLSPSSTSFVRCSVLVAGGALFRKSLWHRCAFRFYFASAADPRSSSDQGRTTKRKEGNRRAWLCPGSHSRTSWLH